MAMAWPWKSESMSGKCERVKRFPARFEARAALSDRKIQESQ